MNRPWITPRKLRQASDTWLARRPWPRLRMPRTSSRALRFLRRACAILLVVGVISVAALGGIWSIFVQQAEGLDLAGFLRRPEATRVVTEDGRVLGILPGGSTLLPVTPEEIPQALIDATLQLEDRYFYLHGGVNWLSVGSAAREALTTGRARGASVIENQLAKMSGFGTPAHESRLEKFYRKIWEWALSRRICREYTKPEILAMYFNAVEFGPRAQGLRAASQWFFGCEPKAMSLEKCALLAAMLKSPTNLSPERHPNKARKRRDLALRLMQQAGLVTPEAGARALAMPVKLRARSRAGTPGCVLERVARELKRRGLELSEKGAQDVVVSLDPDLQLAVTLQTRNWLAKVAPATAGTPPLQATVLVIDGRTGGILAQVTGRDAPFDEFDRTRQAAMPPASVMKPIVVALAYDAGIEAGSLIDNRELRRGEMGFGPPGYAPRGRSLEKDFVTPREALVFSLNRASLRLGRTVGFEAFRELLARASLSEGELPRHPAVFLGSEGVRPSRLAAAYAAFNQGGVAAPEPHLVRAVRDRRSGESRLCSMPAGPVLFSATAAARVRADLEKVLTLGTGATAKQIGLRVPGAFGKTGTSNEVRQALFVGGDDQRIVFVGLQFDRPKPIAGGSASALAFPLWCSVLNAASLSATPPAPKSGLAQR